MNDIKRIVWIDWAKLLGIYLVVVGHSFMPEKGIELETKNFIYSFHMPLFFFLSGYLFNIKNDFVTFIIKGVKSLIIPYVFLNLVAFLFMMPVIIVNQDYSKISEYVYCFAIGHGHAPAGPAWFLLSLYFVRLFSFWILKTNLKFQITSILFLAIISYYNPVDLWWGIDTAMMALPFFIIAYYARMYKVLDNKRISRGGCHCLRC